jgi:hypothetical protein
MGIAEGGLRIADWKTSVKLFFAALRPGVKFPHARAQSRKGVE